MSAAIANRDIDRLEELLDDGSDPNDGADSLYGAPLATAVEIEDPRYAEALIDAGADITPEREDHWTYLHGAVRFGEARTVELLLDAGADPCVRIAETAPPRGEDERLPDARGMTPLDIAVAIGDHDSAALLEGPTAACE